MQMLRLPSVETRGSKVSGLLLFRSGSSMGSWPFPSCSACGSSIELDLRGTCYAGSSAAIRARNSSKADRNSSFVEFSCVFKASFSAFSALVASTKMPVRPE
jgi:hypothetical protein